MSFITDLFKYAGKGIAALCFVFLFLALAMFLLYRHIALTKRRVAALMNARPKFQPDEYGGHYFKAEKAEIAAGVIKVLKHHYDSPKDGLDFSGALPTDTFIKDLQLDTIDSLGTVEFIMGLEEEFHIEIDDDEASKIRTIGDVVDYIASHSKETTT